MATYTVDEAALLTQAKALAGMMAGDTDARFTYNRVNDLMRTGLPLCLDPNPLPIDLERNIARLSSAIRVQVQFALRGDWMYNLIRHRQLRHLLEQEQAMLAALPVAEAAE